MQINRSLFVWGLMATTPSSTNNIGSSQTSARKHVLAYLNDNKDGASSPPAHIPFYKCLIDVLIGHEASCHGEEVHEVPCKVQYQRDECAVIISSQSLLNDDKDHRAYNLTLLHAGEGCPMRRLTSNDIPSSIQDAYKEASSQTPPHVRVATSILVVSADNRILLTRRSSHLRSFPSAWVVPGGHVDPFESSLEQAAARELEEETGIQIPSPLDQIEASVVYESAFPATLENGLVKHRHLIVYMIARLDLEHQDVKVSPNPDEVDATVWIDADQLGLVFSPNAQDAETCRSSNFEARVYQEGKEGGNSKWALQSMSLNRLRQRMDATTGGLENERISTGVRLAIQYVIPDFK
mmetsp:Transcript_32682/g.47910  ORF Transcript_32682/g.47910 Transcript_32682/m.47910 type:complete len:352 (-) Transcript_32682:241-1296(-)